MSRIGFSVVGVLVLATLGFSSVLRADTADTTDVPAYKNFDSNGAHYVFADFQTAAYEITYDVKAKLVTYRADIDLIAPEAGHIVFDAVNEPKFVSLDGVLIQAPEVASPGGETKMRATSVDAQTGHHRLQVEGDITYLVDFTEGVRSAFFMDDLADRTFLENFLPASFEYDRVRMTLKINILGTSIAHSVITNGSVTSPSKNTFNVEYPTNYNSSSIFFHMLPTDRIESRHFTFKSIDGRSVPAMIYRPLAIGAKPNQATEDELDQFKALTLSTLAERESRLGAFPHQQIIVFDADGGGAPGLAGMEYCGATVTEESALSHELTHSFIGRGIQPANGNAGWIDEAITMWVDGGYIESDQTGKKMNDPTSMFSQPAYTRSTDTNAYSTGMDFIGAVASTLHQQGKPLFTDFLREVVRAKKFAPYTNEEFWQWSKDYYGFNLLDLVGKSGGVAFVEAHAPMNIHRRFTREELQRLL
jgi:hypothetical protein